MHEAAHRLLFRNRTSTTGSAAGCSASRRSRRSTSTAAGTWRTTATSSAPTSPTSRCTAATRSPRASFRRKLARDATGQTGWKLFKGLLRGVRVAGPGRAIAGASHRRGAAGAHRDRRSRSGTRGCTSSSGSCRTSRCGASSTGCARSPSTAACSARRTGGDTTHSVRQSWPARFVLVPYHIGWHLAHHVDSGVPMAEPARSSTPSCGAPGYVTDALEYPQLHRALAQAGVGLGSTGAPHPSQPDASAA